MWKPEVGRLVLQSLLKHAKLPVVVLQGRAHRNQGRKGTTNGAEGAHRSDVAAFCLPRAHHHHHQHQHHHHGCCYCCCRRRRRGCGGGNLYLLSPHGLELFLRLVG